MEQLANRQILLCVTGGIAAYKAAELIRLFKSSGSEVRVLMTNAAKEFITPLTMQALSGNEVHSDLLDTSAESAMGHIELARWADAIVISPCSADSLAKLAAGRGDDLMSAVCLAADSKIFFAPAMNQGMWKDKRTKKNIALLKKPVFHQIGPNEGDQACGDVGPGRMSEPKEIIEEVAKEFSSGLLAGKKVLITAGPTREKIDPVRYISNKSSGKMGFSLAKAAVDESAIVTLISGPVTLETPERVERIDIESAEEMKEHVTANLSDIDLFISTAAVADFKMKNAQSQKIKKNHLKNMSLSLEKNEDILKHVSDNNPNLKIVGFAAETENMIDNARKKLFSKNLNLIVANDVSDSSIGFDSNNNEVTLITENEELKILKTSKEKVARKIVQFISKNILND